MTGMVKLTYWLGWVFFVVALISRILLTTGMRERMIEANVLPRNFMQLTIVFFLASVATYTYNQISKP